MVSIGALLGRPVWKKELIGQAEADWAKEVGDEKALSAGDAEACRPEQGAEDLVQCFEVRERDWRGGKAGPL